MSATSLIYQAAMRQRTVNMSSGKSVTYQDIEAGPVKDGLCWLCGAQTTGQGIPVKEAIKPTFTDGPLAKAPNSQSLCKACAFCLSYRELRNYSIVATTETLLHPTRAELRGILLDPPKPPFVICVAVSGQKWVHIKSLEAWSRDDFPVQMEDTTVYVIPEILAGILEPVEALYSAGFRKAAYKDMAGEIETGDYEPYKVQLMGVSEWERLENLVAPHRGTRLFQLALFVAQKKEEL